MGALNKIDQLPYFTPLWARLAIVPAVAALMLATGFFAWTGVSYIANESWIGTINLFWAAITGFVVIRCAALAVYRDRRGKFSDGELVLMAANDLDPIAVSLSDLVVLDNPWLKFASVKSSVSGKTLFATDYIYPHGVSTVIAILEAQSNLSDD
jgi:membrane protein implicated in regulation of membrane protease activity